MAYTQAQLIAAYTAVNDGLAPDAATAQTLLNLTFGPDAAALAYVINSADKTTAVAELTYQFFTGKSPTKAGLDYLVNSPANANDLNDPYYGKFGIENRYINFAANLGVNGEGAAAFASTYGALSFTDYVTQIYGKIVGLNYASAAGVNAANAIADIIGRQSALADIARAAGLITATSSAAQIDLAVKATAAGYIIGEAIKADVGAYAAAYNNFAFAETNGTAAYNVDIVSVYASLGGGTGSPIAPYFFPPATPAPSPVVNLSFRLTTAGETFNGGDGADTFNASDLQPDNVTHATVLNAGDVLNGGAGIDTLTVVSGTGAAYTVAPASISNIEIANITGDNAVTADTTTWTGLNQLGVTSVSGSTIKAAATTAVTAVVSNAQNGDVIVNGGSNVNVTVGGSHYGNISVGGTTAPMGAVVIRRTGTTTAVADDTLGSITVTGGTTVDITQIGGGAAPRTQTLGTITVSGGLQTTSVKVTNSPAVAPGAGTAGIAENTTAIYDINGGSASIKAGVINTISVDGYTVVGIQDNALTTLSLAHGSGNIIIDNSSSLAAGARTQTLNLTINALTGGTLDDADVYTTLNITTTGADSRFANITYGALTALTLSGSKGLTLTSTAGLSALSTVTVSGSAGLNANLTGNTVANIDASATSGAMTVTVNGANATYKGGSGVDTVTLVTGATKAISLGAGDDALTLGALVPSAAISGDGGIDTLSMDATAAATASGSGVFAGLVTGFERLTLTGSTNQTVSLTTLGGYAYVTARGANGLTLNNFASGGALVLDGAGTAYTVANPAFAASASDTLNLKLTGSSGSAVGFATTGITASGVEIVNISTVDGQVTPSGAFNDAVVLLGNSSKTVTVAGNAGLTLYAASTGLTTVDASGITLGGFTFTSGALAGAATIKGSATGANVVDLQQIAAGTPITYVGGSGVDTVTLGATGVSVAIDVGAGADRVNLAAPSASAASYAAISGMTIGSGDTISFTTGAAAAPGAGALGAGLTFATSVANTITTRAANFSDGATAAVHWFTDGTDAYIVVDVSGSAGYADGTDTVVKIVGVTDLSTATVAGKVITF